MDKKIRTKQEQWIMPMLQIYITCSFYLFLILINQYGCIKLLKSIFWSWKIGYVLLFHS